MKYRTSLGSSSRIITTIAMLIIIVIAAAPAIDSGTFIVYPIICSIAIVLLLFAFSTRYYTVTNSSLIVRRLGGNITISRRAIATVERVNRKDIGVLYRLFVSGGVCGFYGTYISSRLGRMTWFVTRKDTLVLVKTIGGKTYLLSPDAPDDFVAHLKSKR